MSKEAAAGNFTLPELVDLALCSPEIGAVNFNILRILLHNIIEKLGIVGEKAELNDLQSHQINNFQNYIQGAGTASPMPGVLRYDSGPRTSDPAKTPRTPRQDQKQTYTASTPRGTQAQQPPVNVQQPHAPDYAKSALDLYRSHTSSDLQPDGPGSAGRFPSSSTETLEKKVARLERHLQALYALPTNSRLLGEETEDGKGRKESTGMSVNDMWQIIQLNNRLAAAEAGIQKMASLIEELAGQIKLLKNADKSTSGIKNEVEKVARTSKDLAMQMEPCMEKCEQTAASLSRVKQDLEKIKHHLVEEIQKLSTAAGLATTRTPSFMEPRVSVTDTQPEQLGGRGQVKQGQGPSGQGKPQGPSKEKSPAGALKTHDQSQQQPGVASQSTGVQQLVSTISTVTTNTDPSATKQISGKGTAGQQGLTTSSGQQQRTSDGSVSSGQQRKSESPEVSGQERSSLTTGQQRVSDGGASSQQPKSDGATVSGQRGSDGGSGGGVDGTGHGERISQSVPHPSGDGNLEHGRHSELGQPEDLVVEDGIADGEEKVVADEHEDEISKQNRSSRIDSDPMPTGEPVEDAGQPKKYSQSSQSELVDDAHGHHIGTGAASDSHPVHRHQGISHVPVDLVELPLEQLEDQLDPFRDYDSPTNLKDGKVVAGQKDVGYEEQCQDQADMVQKELQEQYAKLQEMQKQLADEIQDKMELVYQKLLREIAAQHATTSPYMAIGLNAEKCMGPGVCSGFGLPAGTAVCQFPQKPEKVEVCSKSGKVCPGKDVCPGKEVCPTCKNDILHHLRSPGDGPHGTGMEYGKSARSSSQENLLRQLTSMTLLPRDLEDLRGSLKDRGVMPDVFDEADVLEKLQTLWEAVNVLKNNEENMAVRLVQQDAALKRIPEDAMQKLEHLGSGGTMDTFHEGHFGKGLKGMKDLGAEDVSLIFNNLSSLVLENAAMKEKLQKIDDTVFQFEQNVVTKPMLMNALGDKADKGQMNTKVSYDEFGAGMDELQARLGNLLQEVYRKNELWKEITDQMREDLTEKLDKVDIGPLRAYFKSHLGKLEEKVHQLTRIMEEPDPAGTRKKLLRDYNCLSCDRHTNISGVTNAPLLPILGPIYGGHTTTASKRAFELYRMRPKTSHYDAEGRNYCMMEQQGRGDGNNLIGSSMPLNDSDMLHLVNRYVGGSHTTITTQDRVAALRKRASANAAPKTNVPPQQAPRPAGPAGYFYEE